MSNGGVCRTAPVTPGLLIFAITLRAAGQFLDLSVITGDGVRDDCHLLVLAACSPVFAACSPGPDSCLLLPDFTSTDFINLLGVLYGGPSRLVSCSPFLILLLISYPPPPHIRLSTMYSYKISSPTLLTSRYKGIIEAFAMK